MLRNMWINDDRLTKSWAERRKREREKKKRERERERERLEVYTNSHLSIYLFICISIYIYLSIYLSHYQSTNFMLKCQECGKLIWQISIWHTFTISQWVRLKHLPCFGANLSTNGAGGGGPIVRGWCSESIEMSLCCVAVVSVIIIIIIIIITIIIFIVVVVRV